MITVDISLYLDVMDILDKGADIGKEVKARIQAGDDWFRECIGSDLGGAAEKLGLDPDAARGYFYSLDAEKIFPYMMNIDKAGIYFDYDETDACRFGDSTMFSIAVPVHFDEEAFLEDNRAGIAGV